MRLRHLLVLTVTTVAPQARAQAAAPRPVTLRQFGELSWLIGRWRGSGGADPAFHEQDRFRDDSTIAMTAYPDSTVASATADSSVIEWRDGQVRSRSARSTNEVIEFAPGRIRFRRVGATDGGHRFTRVSADEWVATLFPRGPAGATTVYRMRRVPGPPR